MRAVFLYPKGGELSGVSASRAAELTAKGFAAEVKPKQNKKIYYCVDFVRILSHSV
ncbi:MAG: hypothetical protein II083_00430 [Ruminococcus sp.]|nr:hypothetical protein [Ruminococcus sp.]